MSAAAPVLRLFCPAKLNLHLRITGRRSDGYHGLETVFHTIDLGDDLWARRTDGPMTLAITADDPREALPVQDDNLVCRAARAFVRQAPSSGAFAFHLHKRTPHGGGLGGGSSDAAAALRLCNALAGAPLDHAALHALAAPLGADVPFFLLGGSQWATGIGTDLQSCAHAPQLYVTLIVPAFGCPTAEVYRMYAAHWQAPLHVATVPRVRDHLDDFADIAVRGEIVNDLAVAAELVRPELARLRERAEGLGVGRVAMTGSGSTLFVAAASADEAAGHRRRLATLADQGVRIVSARSLVATPSPAASVWPRAEHGGGV